MKNKLLPEQQDILNEIKYMKKGTFEEKFYIAKYSLENYIRSIAIFGLTNQTTKNDLLLIKEAFSIVSQEKKILEYIKQNIHIINPLYALEFINKLDELNDKTLLYLYEKLENKEDALERQNLYFTQFQHKHTDTLLSTNQYQQEIIYLTQSQTEIQNFFNLDKQFQTFFNNRTKIIEYLNENDIDNFYITPIFNDKQKLIDFNINIPNINDLQTAQIYIKLYFKAFGLYQNFSQSEIDKTTTKNILKKYKIIGEEKFKEYHQYLDNKAEIIFKQRI